MFVKMMMFTLAAGLIAAPGAILYLATSSWPIALAASWLTAWLPCAALIFLLVWAFDRFDVSEQV